MALLGVWFAAPVQVLLQPAVLGLVLAILAAAIDGFVKRRARSGDGDDHVPQRD